MCVRVCLCGVGVVVTPKREGGGVIMNEWVWRWFIR